MKRLGRKMSFRRPQSRKPSPERLAESEDEDNADESGDGGVRTSFALTSTGSLRADAIGRAYVQDIQEAARKAHDANPEQLASKCLLDPNVSTGGDSTEIVSTNQRTSL